jgi:hypothetical protein
MGRSTVKPGGKGFKTAKYIGDPSTCVGVKIGSRGVWVRNTSDPDKITTRFTKREWRLFIEGVKKGQFDV